jgi:hypothetical protein
MDIRTWDLNEPQQARAFAAILRNLRKYTLGPFASVVTKRLNLASGALPIKPWKWNRSVLPPTFSSVRSDRHLETTSRDKIIHWKNGLPKMTSNCGGKSWEKQRLEEEVSEVTIRTKVLSPPSTPDN